MRHFNKGQAPESFLKWTDKNSNKSWDDFGIEASSIKNTLKKTLLEEQGYLCCYCECRVNNDNNSHIEHFKPRNLFPKERFSYNNLHISCTKQGDKIRCGHKKDNTFNNDIISPLEEDCASHFSYKLSGEIEGKDKRGKETIDTCNLNSKALIEMRKALIDTFIYYDDDLREELVKDHLDYSKKELGEFYSMIEYLFSNE